MDSSLERIRAKMAELEARLADLRIAERELIALERAPARKTTAPLIPKVKPKRAPKGSPAHPTISAVIAGVMNEREIAKSEPLWRFSSQHNELVAQRHDLRLKRGS
jgi:hypothetical protein